MRKPTFSENLFDQIKDLIDHSRQQVAASVNAELYLRWLDRHDRQEGELPPIGLLLCSEGNTEHIEPLLLDQPPTFGWRTTSPSCPPKSSFSRSCTGPSSWPLTS